VSQLRIKNEKCTGFTLVDTMLVVVILGILGMIVVPQFNSMLFEAKLNGATAELVSGLEYARALAVKYQRPFGLEADAGENRFKLFDNQYKTDPSPHHDDDPPVDAYGVVLNPLDKTWYIKDLDTMETYKGVSISGGEICFYPDGHCSDPAGPDNTFVVSLSGDQKTITVAGATGRIKVE